MVILLVAMTVGSAYAGVAGVLKVTRGISEVISTIMLNAIAISGLIVAGLKAWQAGGAVGGRRHPGRYPTDPTSRVAFRTSTAWSRSSLATSAATAT